MAPAWGPGVASVVGPVGLLVVLLVGGCAAEGKSLARGVQTPECSFVCVYFAKLTLRAPIMPLSKMPAVHWTLRDSEVDNKSY